MSNLRQFPSRPIPPMTTLTAWEELQKAKDALYAIPGWSEQAAVRVSMARIDAVIQFFESEIAYFNLRGR